MVVENSSFSAKRPIGIFDSGIGGLTVANALRKYLPGEQLIYFGDTAHLPYGDKAPTSIKHYTEKIGAFLMDKGCKLIVNACNTASSIAFEEVEKLTANKALAVNVIDPVVDVVAASEGVRKVGVIGTKGTIRTNVYAQKLSSRNKQLQVASLATPLLVPVIEEMLTNTRISEEVIKHYLSDPSLEQLDVLILGCTHYPLIRDEITRHYPGNTTVVDSADIVGQHVHDLLKANGLLNDGAEEPHEFYVSDYTTSFESSSQSFFGKEILLKEHNLWS